MTDIDQHLENILPHFAKFANLWKAWPIAIPNLSTFNKTLANICSNCCRKHTNNFYLHLARIPVSGLFWKQANLSCNALGKRLTIQINKNIRDNISEMTQHGFLSNTRKKWPRVVFIISALAEVSRSTARTTSPLAWKERNVGIKFKTWWTLEQIQ